MMKSRVLKAVSIVIAVACVQGCQNRNVSQMGYVELKAYAQELIDRCSALGVRPGTPEMQTCGMAEANKDSASQRRRQAVGEAIGESLSSYGRGLQQSRPVSTSCSRFGNSVNCTTY